MLIGLLVIWDCEVLETQVIWNSRAVMVVVEVVVAVKHVAYAQFKALHSRDENLIQTNTFFSHHEKRVCWPR